eukprot:TRINITY_DN43860_c0_g1_i1.p1 TRINITY_DN43860_c0_g1~~TRINITY_DN43860_c0_g1_i1.p1  ORF type:complete len:216 (+),score=31.44 TRINITY_DN43860_c0_g1_i1:66-650(+)
MQDSPSRTASLTSATSCEDSVEEIPRDQSQSSMVANAAEDGPAIFEEYTLPRYFEELERHGVMIVEATHVVIRWHAGGLVFPSLHNTLTHHGFILKASDGTYLRIHFVKGGISWKALSTNPGLPTHTKYSKTFTVHTHPRALLNYCEATKPWAWPGNDCKVWAKGLMSTMGVVEALNESKLNAPASCSPLRFAC